MSDLKFGPINEKMEGVVVEGQFDPPECLCDCTIQIWKSNTSSRTKGCYLADIYTPAGSTHN